MKRALDRYVIRGPRHNVNFLRDVLENERFISGKLTTKFIEEEYADGFHGHVYTASETEDLAAITSCMHYLRLYRKFQVMGKLPSAEEFSDPGAIFISLPDGQTIETEVLEIDENYAMVRVGGEENGVEVEFGFDWDLHEPVFEASFGEEGRSVAVQHIGMAANGYVLQHIGTEVTVQVWDADSNALRLHIPPKEKKDLSKVVISPMPGTVISLDCQVGDKVFGGQALLVLEAMKMQNVLRSPKDTVIKAIHIKPGQEVKVDDVLIEFEN